MATGNHRFGTKEDAPEEEDEDEEEKEGTSALRDAIRHSATVCNILVFDIKKKVC